MFLLRPTDVTDDVLVSSNLPETDHPAWAEAAAYAVGARVILLATHSIYEAVKASTGKRPDLNLFHAERNPAGEWLRLGATNRWRAFDAKIGDRARGPEGIFYRLALPSICTGVALFGLRGASATLAVEDADGAPLWSREIGLTDTSDIVDWPSYFTWTPSFASEALVGDVPGYAGRRLTVEIKGTDARLGQLVFGRVVRLGKTLPGTEIGFEDYSRKERDFDGNAVLVERDYSDSVTFRFAVALSDMQRVKRVIVANRARPGVWFAGEAITNRGATVYGFPAAGLRVPLEAAGVHVASLEIEGLT